MHKKKLSIYDMDGTIVCSLHRYKTIGNKIDLEHWINNDTPEQVKKDSLLAHYKQYKKDLQCKHTTVIIATARTMKKGDHNFDFIEQKMGNPDFIVHRKKSDGNEKGAILKINGIKKVLHDFKNYARITIYEDNESYLKSMTEFFDNFNASVIPVFVKSKQGH